MTLAELIQELAGATDGAAEVAGFRSVHPSFPTITRTRVEYLKRYEKELEISQQEVLVENIDTPEEAAYYNKGRVPAVVVPPPEPAFTPIATPEEIATVIGGKQIFVMTELQNAVDHSTATGYIPDAEVPAEKVSVSKWFVYRDKQGTLQTKQIEG